MGYEVGSVLPFEFSVYDAAGALTNASTHVVTVVKPDGSTATPSVTNASTGVYTSDVLADAEGLWYAYLTTTSPTDVSPAQTFYVESVGASVAIVSLAEVKEHLRITNTSYDEQLRRMAVTATSDVESFKGQRFRRVSLTETYDGGKSGIRLKASPVRSVTTVVESGTTLAATDYFLKGDAPILVRGTEESPSVWSGGVGNVSVTYVAGLQVVPARVRQAVLDTVRLRWESQRGGGDLPAGDAFTYASDGVLPREVQMSLGMGDSGIR